MGTIGSDAAAKMTAELQRRIPIDQTQHYDLVIENDLASRVVLAVLWPHRSQLTIYLVTDETPEDSGRALKTALETVRNAPDVQLTSSEELHDVATAASHLIWALDVDRTSEPMHETLAQRVSQNTATPLFTGFEALDGACPNQTQPVHELILRDVIRAHARFLNFFGDRFDSRDLYQRSKYPHWFTPPEGFDAAVPQLWSHLVDAEGAVLWHREFSGTLQLKASELQVGHRMSVEFAPLGQVVDTAVDLTFSLSSQRPVPKCLQLQVHRNNTLVQVHKFAPDEPLCQVEVSAVQPDDAVKVSVVVTQDAPAGSAGPVLNLQVALHPPGTHSAPSVLSRLKAWLRRSMMRKPQGT